MQNIKTVIIPAAGVGSRLGLNTPKTLLKYKNQTLLSLHLKLIKNFEKIIYVVGYKADEIIDETIKYNRDIIFVRNKDYLKTNTNHSLCLCNDLLSDDEYFLTFDADLYVSQRSFNDFINIADSNISSESCFIGLTKNISTNPVYVKTDMLNTDIYSIQHFSRNVISEFEWANICIMKKSCLNINNNFVYENFTDYLPVKGMVLENCFDIDTQEDLQKLNNKRF